MKLSKITKSDPFERLNVRIRQSVLVDLKAYQAFYEENTGEEISAAQLTEEILKAFMAEDKAFKKFRETVRVAPVDPAASF